VLVHRVPDQWIEDGRGKLGISVLDALAFRNLNMLASAVTYPRFKQRNGWGEFLFFDRHTQSSLRVEHWRT
jgi:hypothetical protein